MGYKKDTDIQAQLPFILVVNLLHARIKLTTPILCRLNGNAGNYIVSNG